MKDTCGMIKVGDEVNVECYSALGSGGKATVKEIKTKYNEDNGKPYKVIVIDDGQEFSAEGGEALTPPTMYYIDMT